MKTTITKQFLIVHKTFSLYLLMVILHGLLAKHNETGETMLRDNMYLYTHNHYYFQTEQI